MIAKFSGLMGASGAETIQRLLAGAYDRRVRQVRDLSCGDMRIYLEVEVRRVRCRNCAKVKREELAFLADNPFYTKRFAYYVGRRCGSCRIGLFRAACA